MTFIFPACEFAGQCNLDLGGLARVGAPYLEFGRTVPDWPAAGSIGCQFLNEPVLRAKLSCLLDAAGHERQQRASSLLEDKAFVPDILPPAHQRSAPGRVGT